MIAGIEVGGHQPTERQRQHQQAWPIDPLINSRPSNKRLLKPGLGSFQYDPCGENFGRGDPMDPQCLRERLPGNIHTLAI